ncbi:protein TolR [Chitinimonas viridis]|uniref:Protein TolR n=2 Tax=Chitinimonas TaxID=240411 RepID=A0ABT8B826_9NEIS|nr:MULTISPECIES: protein TolR [Chitinimonas]MBL8506910.1 protein TolR [Chitinimonas sp.]MDN3578402.1 protein TolR [Chitinimonas viridis]GLR12279.1 protein TolR [Chitinimonas prasina]
MARRQRRAKAEINVVPYIDVMLVLLVIFMVATPMMQPGVVNLPSVDKADRALDVKPLRVEVSRDELMTLEDAGKSDKLATTDDLIAAVKARTVAQARPVLIRGDKEVRYDAIIKVMNALKKSGVERVGLEVMPER